MTAYQIDAIPAFSDNYIWAIHRPKDAATILIDPGDARPAQAWLQQQQKQLVAILITHKHHDHIGGIAELLSQWPDAALCGPAAEAPDIHPSIAPHRFDHELENGDQIRIDALDIAFDILDVRGHTHGHIAYHSPDARDQDHPGQGLLFPGDTLFSVGCGRIFDGKIQDLHQALRTIASLPSTTLAYPTHEYTLDNIGFAQWVEPDNPELAARLQQAHQQLDQQGRTLPTRLDHEKQTNPFLRTAEPTVIAALQQHPSATPIHSDQQRFIALRHWKDNEYD